MFGKEVELVYRPDEGGHKREKYTNLPMHVQINNYYKFKAYYDQLIQRTLK